MKILFYLPFFLILSCKTIEIKNGENILKKEIVFNDNFTSLKVDSGIELLLLQNDSLTQKLKLDKNYANLLRFNIENGTLSISKKNKDIKTTITAYLSFNSLSKIEAAEGSKIKGLNFLTGHKITVKSLSGGLIDLKVKTEIIDCTATGGSKIVLAGFSDFVFLQAKNGSDIFAYKLNAKTGNLISISASIIKSTITEDVYIYKKNIGRVHLKGNPKIHNENIIKF
ncbi:MAG: DUF2807 domain-containing protein [bacterium]|nr:DUF2807 domain-containing protein [bacterium]